jgi:hypothetical protein
LLSGTKASRPFYEHLQVRALIGLGQYPAGLQILESREGGDAVWKNVWLASVFDGLGRAAEAKVCIAEAKAEAENAGYDYGWSNRGRAVFSVLVHYQQALAILPEPTAIRTATKRFWPVCFGEANST